MPHKDPEERKRWRTLYNASGRALDTQRKWRSANKEKVAEYKKRYYASVESKDPEFKRKVSLASFLSRKRRREEALQRYGGVCVCCLEARIEFLSFDHKNGAGSGERKSKQTDKFLREMRVGPLRDDIQILCHNCNLSIGFYGYCPHGNN